MVFNPVSTYRIQFNRSFTLNDLEKYLDYLTGLGVATIYASPLFAAVPGSNHGYDVTGPERINPEIGTAEDFRRLSWLLKTKGVGYIQDIVPNHMAYHPDNRWIWDMLEKGPSSEFTVLFDTEPAVAAGAEKIMLPFLGSDPDQALENNELQLCIYCGSLALNYFDNLYPLNFDTFRSFYEAHIDEAPFPFRMVWNRYNLDSRVVDKGFLNGEWETAKKEIGELCKNDREVIEWSRLLLDRLNGNTSLIRDLIGKQHYEPCHWKETSRRINFRRFFTVNGLICLRMEERQVMEKHHAFLKELVDGGHIGGLRVDHVDGLRDPACYLRRLRDIAGENAYIVVEKILEHGEKLPENWPVEGSSGYDFLALVNNLMVSKKGYRELHRFWQKFTGEKTSPGEIIYSSKKLILNSHMQGELENIWRRTEPLISYAENKGFTVYNEQKGITRETIKAATGEFMLAFPVYRLYPGEYPLDGKTREQVSKIFDIAIKRNASGKNSASGVYKTEKNAPKNQAIKNALLLLRDIVLKEGKNDPDYHILLGEFMGRVMQFTGPLTAKGVEDTSMYRYNCFIAGNEVGDSLGPRGMDPEEFHQAMAERLQRGPLSMNCTSTHDTKRGEDVRARLNATGDLAGEWSGLVRKWEKMNRSLKRVVDRQAEESLKTGNMADSPKSKTVLSPSPGEEYLIYQTIAGTFPFDEKADAGYTGRISEYLVKALREARLNSNWEEPDSQYEAAVCDFAEAILNPRHGFLRSFLPFHRKLMWWGIVNSLSQLVIKCCSPGMPDIYRGTEVWDMSLVDPDNRRPVDFATLQESLEKITGRWKEDPRATAGDLYNNAPDGRIKLLATSLLLNLRKSDPELFLHGEYIPLGTGGRFGDNLLAFARRLGDRWLMCVIPLHPGSLSTGSRKKQFSSIRWKDTRVILPEGSPLRWEDVITGRTVEADGHLSAGELFGDLPVAVMRGRTGSSGRKAGILLHITSLPGKYGIGDFGPEACRFVDFLVRTSQTYWQMLPLAPVTASRSWSPYSSPSAFAMNTLLVNPRQLYVEGLINLSDLDTVGFKGSDRVSYRKASEFREMLLGKSWDRLRSDTGSSLYSAYESFCSREAGWLDDYSLFMACRENYGGREWSRWPAKLKDRDEKSLKTAGYDFAEKIAQEKFNQFIADRQWKRLKQYANDRGILIFGDIPFYVDYDSADVWANRQLFSIRESGKMKTVAGVPPDYFDKNGQLWNMPVYDWDRLRESGYDWWLSRLERNLELFDLMRLDHFRAFSAYWEVPAGHKTAVRGKWTKGPGADFLGAVRERFPSMPYVAEDLGDIDREVYRLRDGFGLPGMQVLQFSFGRDMATSIHTPHNHSINSLAYTGTHDNNTIRGWYERELDRAGRKRLQEYAGKKMKAQEIPAEMIRMALASPARTAIVPLQDWLGLGREARMNIPATSKGNWLWKMRSPLTGPDIAGMISKLTIMYNRRQGG